MGSTGLIISVVIGSNRPTIHNGVVIVVPLLPKNVCSNGSNGHLITVMMVVKGSNINVHNSSQV